MKKILSILLAVVMVIGMLPLSAIGALAADETTGFAISFVVPGGVDAVADMEYTDGGITLPAAGNISTVYDYTFVGWAAETVADTDTAPTLYEAGSVFTAEAATTLYAVYSYSLAGDGATGYVLTDFADLTATDSVVITMTYTDGTTWALNSGNGTSKAPAATVVTVADGTLSGEPAAELRWNVVGTADSFSIYPAGSTATWLYCTSSNNGVRVGTNNANVFSIDADSGYIKHNGTNRYLGVYRTNPDWRCYTNTTGNTANQTLGFYAHAASGTYYTTEIACEHLNITVENLSAATCTEAGYTGDTVCTDCGAITVKGEVIAATGHSYVDDVCTVCGEALVSLDGNYYIAAIRSSGNYLYMTSDLGTASTKRYTAVDSGVAELPASIAAGLPDRTFTLARNEDGTYSICVYGTESYLGWTSGNSGALVAADAALALKVEATGTGAYTIVDAASGRNLSLNSSSGYFAFYTGTQINDLYLISVDAVGAECSHANTKVEKAVDATCTGEGYTGNTVCADCGETVATGEAIPALGHTNDDGDNFCDVCGILVSSDFEYVKTTSIAAGDTVLLVYETGTMELSGISTTSTVYGLGAAYTTAPVGLMPLTVAAGASEGTVAFQTADGLYLCWLSGNSLRTSETLDANSSWNVTFEVGGNAVIVNAADATRTVRWNNTSPRFACYTSGQSDVQLYKLVAAGACQHSETSVQYAVEVTCTTDGYTGDVICNACGETVSYGTTVTAPGHTEVVDAAVAATCTKGGLTEGSHCSVCGEVSSEQKIVTAAGHSYADGVCSVCGEAEVTAPADAAQILAAAYALVAGDALPYKATLTGTVTSIDTAYSEAYNNVTVTIVMAGLEAQPVVCYRMTGEGAATVAVGDVISVTGQLINYNGTVEFASGCTMAVAAPKEYCLVGYINGANYGCEEDYENVGEYIFVDGALSATFTADSYVFVKTTDNANWYLAESYCTGTTVTLIKDKSEKLFVPGNVELSFTLTENEDGSLTLSYEIIGCNHSYEVTESTAATCTEDGSATYTCSVCGDSYTEALAATGHSYADGICTGCGDVQLQAQGQCGNDLYFTLDLQGKLTVTGTGDMWSFDTDRAAAPWAGYQVMEVTVEAGATSIGAYAFFRQYDMKKAVLPQTVTAIDTYAFYCCERMTDLTLPDRLTFMGESAFGYCTSLRSVKVPAGLRELPNNAFVCCFTLQSVELPAGMIATGTWSFAQCRTLRSVTLPEGLETISVNTFQGCYNLNSINIPESVDVIDSSAFNGCEALTQLDLPETMTRIGDHAFHNTGLYSLTIPQGITVIPDEMVSFSENLTTVVLPQCLKRIEGYSFRDCTALKNITIPDGVTEIGAYAFQNCRALQTMEIPDSVTAIGIHAFDSCNALSYIKLPSGLRYITSDMLLSCWSLETVELPDGLLGLGTNAFRDCRILKTVTIPGSVKQFDATVFGDCPALESVTVEEGVTRIGTFAFQNCTALSEVNLPDTLSVIDEYAFFGCRNLGTIEIPASVTVLANNCFKKVDGLQLICFKGSAPTIGEWAFAETTAVAQYSSKNAGWTEDVLLDYGGSITWENVYTPVAPTLSLKYPTVSFEDVIVMNVYYSAANLEDVVEMGLITFNSNVSEWSIENADEVIPGYSYDAAKKMYVSSTNGIAAKNLGDEVFFALYAKLADGTYTYTRLVSYSPKTYAYSQLSTGSANIKPLVVAMLKYGAAAQTFFGHNTDALVDSDLTADQLALIEEYRADMMTAVAAPDAAKQGAFAANGGITRKYPTVSFEGAFEINYYCVPANTPVDGVTMYYWNQADYDAAEVLTAENATAAIKMDGTGTYQTAIKGIAAKDLDKGVYVAFVYSDGTTTYSSGVLAYSIGTYCNASVGGNAGELAKATAVYGYCAKLAFYK